MPKRTIIIIAGLAVPALLAFAMPVSNYFLKRETIEVKGGVPAFKPVSKIMQNKCVDCHTPGMVSDPIYAKLPGASQLIQSDIEAAQKEIVFSKDHLSGEKQFTKVELVRIQNVVENNAMPILPYKIMHWDAGLSGVEKDQFFEWIKAQANAKPTTEERKPEENVENKQTE